MSAYDDVFLAPLDPTTEEVLVEDLNRTLGVTFRGHPTEYASQLATLPGLALDLGAHDYENDGALHFEDYPWVITVRKIGRDAAYQASEARRVFDALKASARFRLLWVNDLQTKVDEFDPRASSGQRLSKHR